MRPTAGLLIALLLSRCASMREGPVDPSASSNTASIAPASASRESPGAQTDSSRVPVGGSPVRGRDDALVTVVEFGDFECPFCSRVRPTMDALRERYGDDLRLVWKNAPLPFHRNALGAAEAAMEAFAQRGNDGFWSFHDLALANPQALDRASLESYASQLGLDLPRFRHALDAHTHRASIDADSALGARLHLRGTPAFVINGTRMVGARPVADFAVLIDPILARARAITPRTQAYARMTMAPYIPPPPPAPRYALADNPEAPTRGAAGAPVVIQIFSDFECPFCARAQPTIEAALAHYPRQVRIVWRDYPLPFHSHATESAEAAREAYAQRGNDGFWAYANLLFAHRDALDRANLEEYARELRLDLDRFRAALDQHTHLAAIRTDVAAADASGAEVGTPAFFVNGRFRAGAMPFADLAEMIDAALAPSSPAP